MWLASAVARRRMVYLNGLHLTPCNGNMFLNRMWLRFLARARLRPDARVCAPGPRAFRAAGLSVGNSRHCQWPAENRPGVP